MEELKEMEVERDNGDRTDEESKDDSECEILEVRTRPHTYSQLITCPHRSYLALALALALARHAHALVVLIALARHAALGRQAHGHFYRTVSLVVLLELGCPTPCLLLL